MTTPRDRDRAYWTAVVANARKNLRARDLELQGRRGRFGRNAATHSRSSMAVAETELADVIVKPGGDS